MAVTVEGQCNVEMDFVVEVNLEGGGSRKGVFACLEISILGGM
jgi:hypothetical protein